MGSGIASGSIRLIGLSKRYGTVTAVDDLNLDVRGGEFLTLLGPSGSGKTTVLMAVAGLVLPTAGRILIDDRDITFRPPHRRNVGVVFQNYALFPHLTVFENVAFPLRMRALDDREIARRLGEALEMVRLPEMGLRYPFQLSGGQQQRVALARAMVYKPPVLLMDEPLGALDKKLRVEMQLEIKELHRAVGLTVMYVTHDQDEALTMSDRIAVMNRGRLEQLGPPRELYDQPRTRFVAEFLGDSNLFEGVVAAVGDAACLVEVGQQTLLQVPQREGLRVGQAARVLVRPERLEFVGPEDDHENQLAAIVREVIYGGDATRWKVETAWGMMLTVKHPTPRVPVSLGPGEKIRVGWRLTDGVVL